MKTQKSIITTIMALLVMSLIIFTGCPHSTSDTPPTTPSESYITGASDNDGDVTSSLVNATLEKGDDDQWYVVDGPYKYEFKDAASSWNNMTNTVCSIESAGSDKILQINYDLQGSKRQTNLSFLLDGKDLRTSVYTSKLYIPESYATPGEVAYPQIRFFVKFGNDWTTGYFASLNTKTIGSGWKTIAIDIANKNITIAGQEITVGKGESITFADVITEAALSDVRSVGIEFYADGIPSTMEGSFFIDYTNITGIAAALPSSPSISFAANSVTLSAEEGSTVYYTLDGTTPTASSTAYTSPIAVTEAQGSVTVKAIAIRDGVSSVVVTKECTYQDLNSAKSLKMTFSDSTVGPKKPYLTFKPTTPKAISSIKFDLYTPEAAYNAGVTGGKIYFKTGDAWDWKEGGWTNTSNNDWVTFTATYDGDDVLQVCGFSGYIDSEIDVEDLALYFDNFIVTYQDGTSDSFDFSDGSTTGFSFTSDTGSTGTLEISSDFTN